MDEKLFNILACPLCKGKLVYDEQQDRLICKFDKIAYPIRDGIPIMLIEEAQKLSPKEFD